MSLEQERKNHAKKNMTKNVSCKMKASNQNLTKSYMPESRETQWKTNLFPKTYTLAKALLLCYNCLKRSADNPNNY